MSTDLIVSIALTTLLVLVLRFGGSRDVWPEPSATRFQLGWPRGVQEEEPVRFRTELLTRRGTGASARPTTATAARAAKDEPAFNARSALGR